MCHFRTHLSYCHIYLCFPLTDFISFSNFRVIYQCMYFVNDWKVIRTRNEIMHFVLLNVNENGCRSAKTPLFVWNNNFETDDKKKGWKVHYNKAKLILSVLFYSFFFFFQLLLGKYDGNVEMTKLSRPITARHVRISPQYWERGLRTKIDLLGCGIGSSGNRKSKVAFA